MFSVLQKLLRISQRIEITDEVRAAFNHIEKTSNNFYLTGNAGSGKSTFIEYFRRNTKKNVAVLAPTGLAAVNIRGQTIHSFFRFPPRIITEEVIEKSQYRGRLFKQLDTIVIDESSMIRADLLDGVDMFLRKLGKNKQLSFGGVQVVLVGDLFQLPPVVTRGEEDVINRLYDTPYFFSSRAYQNGNFQKFELTKIFRQENAQFISLLNLIRKGNVYSTLLDPLNSRVKKKVSVLGVKKAVTLTTTNKVAEAMNKAELAKLNTQEFVYNATIEGNFPVKDYSLPVELDLRLRKGTRVMFVKNGGKWVNGTLGFVYRLSKDKILVKIDESKEVVDVPVEEWEFIKYTYNTMKEIIEEKIVGVLKQYPLRLAWAITIHKSQGMTFRRVNIDYSRSPFAHGQTYVALSRCTTLQGITLSKTIYPNDVIVDDRVLAFLNR